MVSNNRARTFICTCPVGSEILGVVDFLVLEVLVDNSAQNEVELTSEPTPSNDQTLPPSCSWCALLMAY